LLLKIHFSRILGFKKLNQEFSELEIVSMYGLIPYNTYINIETYIELNLIKRCQNIYWTNK
jgi:hypothetical protein